jgi:XTP/dITP diphosphohydrolase
MIMSNPADSFLRLVKIMDELREQCPWDRKQTIQSLRHLTIEELYELADAITENDWKGIKEELGDLLLHIVFYARIGKEQNQFTLDDVLNGICDKLVARHPHIYGDVKVNGEEDVKRNWERLKLKEGKKSVLSGVPQSLPAMVKAMRLQEKAKQVGFEWENRDQVWEKVEEEIQELQSAISSQQLAINSQQSAVGSRQSAACSLQSAENSLQSVALQEKIEDELGDVFFSLINYARFLQSDAENALERTNKKFISRFTRMEEEAQKQNKNLDSMSLEEMDAIWNHIKQQKPS